MLGKECYVNCQLHYVTVQLSVLWHCWLGGRKAIQPVKKLEWWGAGIVICLERGADLHMAQLMSLPLTVSCFRKIQTGFTFLVPAHLGSPGQRAVKRVCVQRSNTELQHQSPVSASQTDGASSCRLAVVVLVTRVHSGLNHFLLKDSTKLVSTDASHERCRIWNANQPL